MIKILFDYNIKNYTRGREMNVEMLSDVGKILF